LGSFTTTVSIQSFYSVPHLKSSEKKGSTGLKESQAFLAGFLIFPGIFFIFLGRPGEGGQESIRYQITTFILWKLNRIRRGRNCIIPNSCGRAGGD